MNIRLLVTYECERACPGCCNRSKAGPKPGPLAAVKLESLTSKDLVMITGGEPLLFPIHLITNIAVLKRITKAKIVVYTAAIERGNMLLQVINAADGVTLTLHTQADADLFMTWAKVVKLPRGKLLRLNIFAGIRMLVPKGWKVKQGITWVKDCPLPAGETFVRLEKLWNRNTDPFKEVEWPR